MRPDEQDRFVIAAHHPDRLRRPPVCPTAPVAERMQQALLWNVFRTLELITPSFWLRRLHVRLTGEPMLLAPQVLRVRLWSTLPLPWVQHIDGKRSEVMADVLIETEDAVWTLVAESHDHDLTDGDHVAAIVDAGAWFAGTRPHYCGVIELRGRPHSVGLLLQSRYSRSRDSARLRSTSKGPAAPAFARWGRLQWSQLATVLADCSDATSVSDVERTLAANALQWLRGAGIKPDEDRPLPRRVSG